MGQRRQFSSVVTRWDARNTGSDLQLGQDNASVVGPTGYPRYPDDATYTEFSPSLDRLPIAASKSTMVDHLEALNDNDLLVVLENVLGVEPERAAASKSDMGLISVMLSIRSRPTYDAILSSIRPKTLVMLIYNLLGLGAFNLSHLLLRDLAVRPGISAEAKLAIIQVCSFRNKIKGLDRSYVSRLAASMQEGQLGIFGPRHGGPGFVQGNPEMIERWETLLLGYMAEKDPIRTDAERIYHTLFSFVLGTRSLKQEDTPLERTQVRRAKWLAYRVIAGLLERGEFDYAEQSLSTLSDSSWLEYQPTITNRPVEDRALDMWMAIVTACNDLKWVGRSLQLLHRGQPQAERCTLQSSALKSWHIHVEHTIRLAIASNVKEDLAAARTYLVGSGWERLGFQLSDSIVQGLYEACSESFSYTPIFWSAYMLSETGTRTPQASLEFLCTNGCDRS